MCLHNRPFYKAFNTYKSFYNTVVTHCSKMLSFISFKGERYLIKFQRILIQHEKQFKQCNCRKIGFLNKHALLKKGEEKIVHIFEADRDIAKMWAVFNSAYCIKRKLGYNKGLRCVCTGKYVYFPSDTILVSQHCSVCI